MAEAWGGLTLNAFTHHQPAWSCQGPFHLCWAESSTVTWKEDGKYWES